MVTVIPPLAIALAGAIGICVVAYVALVVSFMEPRR